MPRAVFLRCVSCLQVYHKKEKKTAAPPQSSLLFGRLGCTFVKTENHISGVLKNSVLKNNLLFRHSVLYRVSFSALSFEYNRRNKIVLYGSRFNSRKLCLFDCFRRTNARTGSAVDTGRGFNYACRFRL